MVYALLLSSVIAALYFQLERTSPQLTARLRQLCGGGRGQSPAGVFGLSAALSGVVLFVILGATVLASFHGFAQGEHLSVPLANASAYLIFVPLLAAFEEIVFRGAGVLLLRDILRGHVILLLLLSSLAFALLHGFETVRFSSGLVSGLLYGSVALWTESLVAAIAVHIAYNALVLLLVF